MKPFAVMGLLCLLAGSAAAQDGVEGGAYRLKVESHLVNTTLTVRDAKGALVTGLPQTAFHVREDGVEQTVKYFASQRELPLSIGLIVDVSDSQEKFVKEHEGEVEAFLREVMDPRDRAFAVCFGNHLRLTSDWTGSASAVLDGVRAFHKGDRGFPEIGPKEERVLGTALYDAVYYGITEKLASERGRRKVLVVFSDGEENSSEHDLLDAIGAAQSGDVLVYALRTTETHHGEMNARNRYGMRVLDHLTGESGGASFDVRAVKVSAALASIAADLRSLYEVGYYSTNTRRDRTFRKVTVSVDGEGYAARSRGGYTSP